VRLIKLAVNWLREQFWKDQTPCYLLHAQSRFLSAQSFLDKSYFTAVREMSIGLFRE
jgi:hypothetical protein